MSHRASPIPPSANVSAATAASVTSTMVNVVPVSARSNKHSLFNPPRRRFAVPLTPHDPEMHQAVMNAMKYHYQLKQAQEQQQKVKSEVAMKSQVDAESSVGTHPEPPPDPVKSAAEILWEKRIQAMESQLLLEKEGLEKCKTAAKKAREDLQSIIQERDEKRQALRIQREREMEALESLKQQRSVIMEKIVATKDMISTLESKRRQHIEEKKRKAVEMIYQKNEELDEAERATKRAKLEESSASTTLSTSSEPTSQVKQLEQQLQEKRDELNKLDQVRTGVIWLMKQVILVEMKNKKREVE